MRLGDPVCLERLHHELVSKDWFMTLLDLEEYIQVRDQVYRDYEDRDAWNEKALVNIAKAGFFSSDRTIAEYNRDIWASGLTALYAAGGRAGGEYDFFVKAS